jgi:hypothetical protein
MAEVPKVGVDKDWFVRRMKQLNINKWAPIAREIGIEKSMMTRSLNGQREFTTKDIVGLARVLDTTPDEILRHVGYQIPQKGVVIVGNVRDDGKISNVSLRKGELFPMLDPPIGAQAIVGEMSSAGLSAYNGATFVYATSDDKNPTPLSAFGQLCVVEATGHLTPYLGTLVKGKERGSTALELFGGREKIDLTEIQRVSPVVIIHFP